MTQHNIDFKVLIEEFADDNISVKRHKELREIIHIRIHEVWKFICKTTKADLSWYAFSNDKCAFDCDCSDGGKFDPVEYKEFIYLIGEFNQDKLYSYEDGFPTELLWDEDYKNTVKQTLVRDKKEFLDKQRKEKQKQKELRAEDKERKEVFEQFKKLPTEVLKTTLKNL